MTIDAKTIDALLPQTQCGDCGFPGCLPYAQALATGAAPIDRCQPGGKETIQALGNLLGIDARAYLHQANVKGPATALIRQADCIGCTKCIQACPVDAIMGARELLHVVIKEDCTGCGLCLPPCPVDCIELLPLEKPLYDKEAARDRFQAKQRRLLRQSHEKAKAEREKQRHLLASGNQAEARENKRAYIQQALARKKRV